MSDMISAFDTLNERGFIEQCSDKGIESSLQNENVTLYVGFDPTADSLHLGHLVPLIAMAHLQRAGHQVLAIVGGATGMVGDPSGKSQERKLLTPEQVAHNVASIKKQMDKFLDFEGSHAARLLDNNDWISRMSFIDWLREVGKYFTVNYMLAKDSVKVRLGSEQGISYTEFSYMTMQAYDFLHLFDHYDCSLQCGGNDQWGNIAAGIDLVRRVRGQSVYGMTFPLVTSSTGEKFGKSAGNAVWLDPNRTKPYQFYQYWMRTDDRDVERYLMLFTFLRMADIRALHAAHQHAPERREAQRVLAAEMTRIVHGEEGIRKARQASEILFGEEVTGLSDRELLDVFLDVPSTQVTRGTCLGRQTVVDLLLETDLCNSRGQARRLIDGGGAYLNNHRIDDPEAIVTAEDLASESMLVLRTGKKNYHLVRLT